MDNFLTDSRSRSRTREKKKPSSGTAFTTITRSIIYVRTFGRRKRYCGYPNVYFTELKKMIRKTEEIKRGKRTNHLLEPSRRRRRRIRKGSVEIRDKGTKYSGSASPPLLSLTALPPKPFLIEVLKNKRKDGRE